MKHLICTFLLSLVALSIYTFCQTPPNSEWQKPPGKIISTDLPPNKPWSSIRTLIKPTKATHNPWQMSWSEEFNDNVIDPKYWSLQEGAGIWGNKELQCYTPRPDNCYVSDGKLIIQALREDFQASKYTSARITTKDKMDFLYGKIEIRAKLPAGKGIFPAFWLLPREDNYHNRHKNGELDIMEMLGHEPNIIYGVAHFDKKKAFKTSKTFDRRDIDFSQDFHRFALEWSPHKLKWLVDDNLYYSLDLDKHFDENYSPFKHRFFLIMNLAIGGSWPGSPSQETRFPAVMEIDYLRYYKYHPLSETK